MGVADAVAVLAGGASLDIDPVPGELGEPMPWLPCEPLGLVLEELELLPAGDEL